MRPPCVRDASARVQSAKRRRFVASLTRWLGVSWATVMSAVRDYGTPLVDDPGRVVEVSYHAPWPREERFPASLPRQSRESLDNRARSGTRLLKVFTIPFFLIRAPRPSQERFLRYARPW